MNADVRRGTPPAVHVQVRDEFDVARVIRTVSQFCREQALSELFGAHVATAASELANNLWMYALRGGHLRLTLVQSGERRGVELVAEDDGPGIADLSQALVEGFSTAGGLGCGLSGVARLMDTFSIDSAPGVGTRVVTSKWTPSLR